MSTCERDVSDEETGGDGTNIDGGECVERAARSVGSECRRRRQRRRRRAASGTSSAHEARGGRGAGRRAAPWVCPLFRRWLRHTPSVQGVHSAHGRCGEAGERAGRAGVGRGSGEGWRRAQAKRTSRVVTDSNDCRLRYLPRLAANSCCPVWKQERCVHAAQVHNIY